MSKGKVRFLENGETTEEYRTVFSGFTSDGICQSTFESEEYQYVILPNNKEEIHFDGCVSADTLTFHNKDFPFPRYSGSGSTITHKNYFVKVN